MGSKINPEILNEDFRVDFILLSTKIATPRL